MDFNIAVNQVSIIFIIIVFGIIAKKTNAISTDTEKSLSSILLKIGMPALALSSANFEYSSEVIPNIINIFVITIMYYIIIILFSAVLAKILKIGKGSFNVFISLIVFANVGFMGYPVAYAFFGQKGVFYASLVNLVFSCLVWTFGILLFNSSEKINIKKLFNIGTVSSLMTIALFLFKIKLPFVLQSALDITGKMTIPVSMILIGSLIADIHIREILYDWKVFAASIARLIIAPLITAISLKYFNFNSTVVSICVLMAAMPSAATNAIFAKEYNCEPVFASVGVFVSTLLSLISLPFIVYMLTKFIM